MGKEEEVSEVKEAVENGVAPIEKQGDSVVDKTDDAKDGVKDMEEDTKDEDKVETQMDVDKEETGELEKGDVKQDSESKEKKEDQEPKSEAVEEENGPKSEEENKDKVASAPGLSVDNQSADKDARKSVSKRKRGKEIPKAGEEKSKIKKTVEKKIEDPKTPVPLAIDRPVRERKSVERLVATIEKDSGKEFHIEKGRGTALKDIPNVAYKLSRKKSEETYKLLHTILFGRRGKAPQVKSNILQFSGFVWHDNEDKQKNKIKEKLDKCVKEKLLEFCDVLDLPIARATTKKEDIVTKLFEFLEAPQATTSELLADKELSGKGSKRKRLSKKSPSTSRNAPSKSSAKSQKRNVNASKGEENNDTPETDNDQDEQEDDDVNGEQEDVDGSSDGSEDEKPERAKSEEKETDSGAESEEETKKRKRVSKKSSVKKNTPEKAKPRKATTVKKASPPPKKAPSRPSSSHSKVQDSDTSPKTFTRKRKTEAVKEKSPTPKKSASKDIAGKKVIKGKEKKLKVEKLKPSDAELKNATCEILKEVDFNTATFTDILKLLGERFNTDLVPRKATVKHMIQEELMKLAEEDDEEDEEVEAIKNDKQASGPGLEV